MAVRRRGRLILSCSLPLLAAGLLYGHATRPARLRAACAAALEQFGFSTVELGVIRFTPWGGLELTDLRLVRVPPGSAPARARDHDCEIRVHSARARCGWLSLLLGAFEPTSVEVDGAVIDLVQARSGELGRWQALGETGPGALPQRLPDLPRVRVRSADVRLRTEGEPRLLRRWILNARGEHRRPDQSSGARAYVLRIDQVGGSATGPRATSDAPLLELVWQDDGLSAALDWLDLELLAAAAPRSLAPWLARLEAAGYVRVSRFAADERGLTGLELRLEEAAFCLPVEDADLAPADRFLHVTQASGTLHLRQEPLPDSISPAASTIGAITCELRGLVNGAPASLRTELLGIQGVSDSAALAGPSISFAGGRFSVGDYRLECHLESMEFPAREPYGAFFGSSNLPGPVRAFLHDYEPAGRFSMSFSVRPPDASDTALGNGPQVDGVMELHGASCRYFRFPYAVHDITGRVRLAGGVLHLDGLVGRHGSAVITGSGRVLSTEAWAGLDLIFDATNVPLDGALFAALPADYQRLWRQARPIGLCDLRTVVRRPTGSAETGPLEPEVTVDARLVAGSLSLTDGGSDRSRDRMRAADGWVRIADGEVRVRDLGGQLGGGTIRVDGTVGAGEGAAAAGMESAHSHRELRVEATTMPLSYLSEVVVADPEAVFGGGVRSLGRICFEGNGEVWGQLGEAGREDYCVRVREGVLTGFDPQETWRETEGWIVSRASGEQRVSLTSRRDGGRLELSGCIRREEGRTEPVTLSLAAEDASMDRLLRGLVPPAWATVREALGVSGAGRVLARLGRLQAQAPSGAASEEGADATQVIEVELEAEKLRFAPLPLELRDVQASAKLGEGGYEIAAARARYAEGGVIGLRGRGGWPTARESPPPRARGPQPSYPNEPQPPAAARASDAELERDRVGRASRPPTSAAEGRRCDSVDAWTELAISAHGLPAGPALFDALPAGLAELMRKMSLRGTLDVNLEDLRVEQGGKRWKLAGTVSGAHLDLDLGLSARGLDCELSGECESGEDGEIALASELLVHRGALLGRPVTNLTGRILRVPRERWMRLEQLHGGLCGGRVFGYAHIDPSTADYELSVTLQDVVLRELVSREPPAHLAAAAGDGGRLDGRVFVRGRGTQVHGRVGGGELRIRGASWLALPVSASLLAAGRSARQPVEGDPQVAGLRFVWEGDTLRFTFVEIQTPELRFVGAGRWDLRSDALTMTLVAAPPSRLGKLGDLLKGAGANLMQYRVTGTAAAPRVTVEPLRGISQALEQLLRAP
jgi:hypothetical protein